MLTTSCVFRPLAIVCVLAGLALAQNPDQIVANQNRMPAGKLENGVLSVALEIRSGTWHAEAEDGPPLFVQAFAEAGQAAQIPGPLLRMPEGTTLHITVANKLKMKATVYGLATRPCDPAAGVDIAPGESHEFSFAAGAPGTYYYWARTTDVLKIGGRTFIQPLRADAQLNGAFIVDPAGVVAADRVFVIDAMFVAADAIHPRVEVLSINGKMYPFTEPLEYAVLDRIRWRVINTAVSEHPMHLHGSFYDLLSVGSFDSDTAYAFGDRQSVVTKSLLPGTTMMMEWSPSHAGRWLFHCHLQLHISSEERLPTFTASGAPSSNHHEDAMNGMMSGMNDMAGLVLAINVKSGSSTAERAAAVAPRKIDLVLEPNAADAKSRTFSCSVREGKKIVASEDKSMGPPIVVTRDEPVEVTVVNHLTEPTTIHWHGLELDSYYDGVVGGGDGNQVTPAIPPGGSFVARFTPNRAGTFIYHTHASDPGQLPGGVYGGLIVLDPGQTFDAEHDRLLMIGARENDFSTSRITLNGLETFSPIRLKHGVKYRLRVVNMAPNLGANFLIGTSEHPATWHAIAKDGATLPARLAKAQDAALHIVSGEAYDFEFQPETVGEIPLQIENLVGNAKVFGKIVVE